MAESASYEFTPGEHCSLEVAKTVLDWMGEIATLEEREERVKHAEALKGIVVGDAYLLHELWALADQRAGARPASYYEPVVLMNNPSGELTPGDHETIAKAVEEVQARERKRRQRLSAMSWAKVIKTLDRIGGIQIVPGRGKGSHCLALREDNQISRTLPSHGKDASGWLIEEILDDLGIDLQVFLDA